MGETLLFSFSASLSIAKSRLFNIRAFSISLSIEFNKPRSFIQILTMFSLTYPRTPHYLFNARNFYINLVAQSLFSQIIRWFKRLVLLFTSKSRVGECKDRRWLIRKIKIENVIQLLIIMGQAYCQSCCGVKNNELNTTITDFKGIQGDAPEPKFAKAVKQFIQVNPKIKEIFVRERIPHISERKGAKLNLYYLFSYAAYYDGEWKNGLPHGSGRLIYDDGSIYEGCFKQGAAQCRNALFIKENGVFYKGQVKMNKAEGDGTLTTDKMTYRGQWHNDLPNGEGHEVYSRISYYMGNFINGKKSGTGHYQWNQVEYYKGEFKQNIIHGYGKHVTKQYQYEGTFQNGQKSGTGTLKNTLKKWEYSGSFKNNKMNGKGTFKWADGTVFIGEFQENQKKQGKLITAQGQIIQQK